MLRRDARVASDARGAALAVSCLSRWCRHHGRRRRKRVTYTLNCYGRGRSDCASSPVKWEAVGVLSRFTSSLNSCASEPSALLPACALRLGRVGCAACGAS